MWVGVIWDVATWYSSGWNWWKLLRSISVTCTPSCLARRRAQPIPANPPPTTTTRSGRVPVSGMAGLRRPGPGAESLEQVVADADGVRHRGQRRVHGAD